MNNLEQEQIIIEAILPKDALNESLSRFHATIAVLAE